MNSCTQILTKFGYITIFASQKGLKEIKLKNDNCKFVLENDMIKEAKHQIIAYFEGKLKNFSLPIDYEISSVLKEVMKIPYGETISYKELGKITGEHPRKVAKILKKNPFPIIIPCHRVIYNNGKIGGYSYGVNWKINLLRLENSIK